MRHPGRRPSPPGALPRRLLEFAQRTLQRARSRARRLSIAALTRPRKVGLAGSRLRFHVHSGIEEYRIRSLHETWTIAWMRALPPGSVLYDIGANIGVGSLLAAEDAARDIKVVAVEPFPANFASLVKNTIVNGLQDRVTALPFGLGARTAILPLRWANAEPGGALHSFGAIVRPRTSEPINPVAHHQCVCYRLDDLVQIPGLPFPTHIKIDVDGGELEVLAGALAVLRDPRCAGLQVEVIDYDEEHSRSREVIGLVEAAGFRMVAEHPHAFPRVRDLQFARP